MYGVGVIFPFGCDRVYLSENLGGTMVILVSPVFIHYAPELECSNNVNESYFFFIRYCMYVYLILDF